jgi:tetratricopeptide (TPR) repeat protein
MIVKDEERFLEEGIMQVKDIVDEIIIVFDHRSTDRSREIVKKLGIDSFEFQWIDDFSAIRNFSLEKATSDWILVVDADERLTEAGKDAIRSIVNDKKYAQADIIGFKLDQRTYNLQEGQKGEVTTDPKKLEKMFSGHQSSMLVRLFKNSPKVRFVNKVHELVEKSITENKGKIVDTDIVIHHFNMLKDKGFTQRKTDTYIDLIWEQLKKEPDNPRYNRQAAIAFLDRGRPDLAMKYFQRTLKIDPQHPGIMADIAKLYLEKKQVQQSIKFFNMAIAVDKKDVSSMNNLAFIYMNLKKFSIAKKLLDKALQIEPNNEYVLANHKKLSDILKKSNVAK